jgi:hypothetical protein
MTTTDTQNTALLSAINALPARSAWARGVRTYAAELVKGAETDLATITDRDELKRALLNGAGDWKAYSEGGCALIYNHEIADRLCSPSELKKTRDGERQPNSRETWTDCQARALFQAFNLVKRARFGIL